MLKENIENLYDAAVQLDIPQLQQLCEDHVQQLKADKAAGNDRSFCINDMKIYDYDIVHVRV